MRYIDKSINKEEGIAVTAQFLDRHCKGADGRHRGIKYRSDDRADLNTFCAADNGGYRDNMVEVLRGAQNSLCCYCLRKLKANQNTNISVQTITIEHIIPDSYSSADDVEYYRSAPNLSAKDVEMTDIYESGGYQQKKGLHPHKVSFNNFVLSCKGTFPDVRNKKGGKSSLCCNEKRGNKEAYPVYFLPEVPSYVDYLMNGDIQAVIGSPEEAHVRTLIESANLQCDSLKDIRYLWYLLRNETIEKITACNHDDGKRNNLLSMILFSGTVPAEKATMLFAKFIDETNWDTFMLYYTFHDIMRSLYH